mmetsp:Transcript_42645/g.31202  ORF Transcript_42645/g.31202 Transcript_42645/m.31202 type:complete len:100 (+) Transcript_42645:855-1154(+)
MSPKTSSEPKKDMLSNEQRIQVDRMFKRPLIFSTILLALAHGANEVNVSAPCAAMLFLLNSNKSEITTEEAYFGMAIGLSCQLMGLMTLGKLYLKKKRK